jgi:hypothetical protein
MAEEGPFDPYVAVLADLEGKKAQLEQAIATIKALQSGGAIPTAKVSMTAYAPTVTAGLNIKIDTFHGLTLAQSVKKYLTMRKEPVTTQDIIDALKEGGQSGSDGSNFQVVVSNSLNRQSASDGEISRVKKGVWGLKSWYAGANKEE